MQQGEVFDALCPAYMSYGMTYDEYWHGNPWMAQAYYKAHMMKLEQQNQMLWLQGFYVFNAFAVVLGNAFGGKGKSKQKYIEKPVQITPKTPEQKKLDAINERQKIINQLTAWATRWDKKQGG